VAGQVLIVSPSAAQTRWLTGTRPGSVVFVDGRFAPCPDKPNCVNSQASDALHAIAPLKYSGSAGAAMLRLQAIVAASPGATLIEASPAYLHAEFRSRMMGFVDDVQLLMDEGSGVVHVRSASRLGYGDFGVNRRRIETIRAQFNAASAAGGRD
jgi:uncharacterized protein (DUF1499 family)